jgi:hypothetical protein
MLAYVGSFNVSCLTTFLWACSFALIKRQSSFVSNCSVFLGTYSCAACNAALMVDGCYSGLCVIPTLRPGQDVSLFVNNECQMLRSMRMVQQSLDLCKPRRRDEVGEFYQNSGTAGVFAEDSLFKWQQVQLFRFVPVAGR